MSPNLGQFALISTLLMNWDGIRLRMEPISPELADELSKIAAITSRGFRRRDREYS